MFRLLIVDDEIHVVEKLAATLPWEELGVQTVYRAFSAHEALEILSGHSVDLLITDIHMPGMTGLELIRSVREHSRKTKCIVLSGHAEFDYAREALLHEAEEYLLKPVKTSDLIQSVKRVLDKLQAEWADIVSRQRMTKILNEHFPLLQQKLLNDLLQGRRFADQTLREKMAMLDIPRFPGSSFAMMLVRMEGEFRDYDDFNLSLMEYAIGNIAQELFGEEFELWHCKDAHEFLVFLVKVKADSPLEEHARQERLVRRSAELQEAVNQYLKGKISVLLSRWGLFPGDLATLYRSSISTLRCRIGSEQELLTMVEDELEQAEIQSLQSLYEYPTLNHLLESGQWEAIPEKLELIFEELLRKWSDSQEHLLEVYFSVSSSFAYIAHKNGRRLADLSGIDAGPIPMPKGAPFHSIRQLQDWALHTVRRLKEDTEKETRNNRSHLIRQIRQYVQSHLFEDVSLKAVAEQVYLHPVYLSTIFKLETGELFSDYVFRLKMDRAGALLRNSQEKVYEIASRLGYQRTHSFIHAFKKQYGVTPQEYRNAYTGAAQP